MTLSVIKVITASWPPRLCALDSQWITAISMTDRPPNGCLFFWAPYLSGTVYVPNSSITIRRHTGSGPAFTHYRELKLMSAHDEEGVESEVELQDQNRRFGNTFYEAYLYKAL